MSVCANGKQLYLDLICFGIKIVACTSSRLKLKLSIGLFNIVPLFCRISNPNMS